MVVLWMIWMADGRCKYLAATSRRHQSVIQGFKFTGIHQHRNRIQRIGFFVCIMCEWCCLRMFPEPWAGSLHWQVRGEHYIFRQGSVQLRGRIQHKIWWKHSLRNRKRGAYFALLQYFVHLYKQYPDFRRLAELHPEHFFLCLVGNGFVVDLIGDAAAF